MEMKTKINNLFRRLVGRKYYLCIINQTGTALCFVNSTPFCTRRDLKRYIDGLDGNASYSLVEVVTFRSRLPYRRGRLRRSMQFLISK